jgi:hypothetical protein
MNASHTRYAHMRQALDTPTQVSQGDRPTGNRGQLLTTSAEGQERLQNGAWPDIRVWVYKPDRTRGGGSGCAGTRCRGTRPWATLSSQSAPEMKASLEMPGPPACAAWCARKRSNDSAGAPMRPNDSTDRGTKGRLKTRASRPAPLQHPCAPQPSWEAVRLPGRRTWKLDE